MMQPSQTIAGPARYHAAAITVMACLWGCVPCSMALEEDETRLDLPDRKTQVYSVIFVAFDCETTGFNPKKERVVEIGAVKFRHGEVIEARSWMMNPGTPIPVWASEVHGITDDMVENKPSFKEAYPDFLAFTRGAVLIAHNAVFDISFIKAEAERAGLDVPPNDVLDSLKLFRVWLPGLKSYALEQVAKALGVDAGGYHRALADSVYVKLIFDKGLENQRRKLELGELADDAQGALTF